MDTYEFVSSWVKQQMAGRPGRVLDYGCGAGQIIKLLRASGVDAWGCDVFYEGGDYSTRLSEGMQPFIRRMTGTTIPYEDNQFDLVVSNQVFEHVPDMDQALREIARVLKPGGMALNVFPDRGVWREGHCGIPFLHWFPKGSTARVYYAACLRRLGLGTFTDRKGIMQWSRDFCDWLDKWTYYRTREHIEERFNFLIGETTHAEEKWLSARFNGRFDALPIEFQRVIVRKTAGLTLVSTKTPRRAALS